MAKNTPNKPDDKKTVPTDDKQNKNRVAPVKESVTAGNEAPPKEQEKEAGQENKKSVPDNKLSIEEARKRREALKDLDPMKIANKDLTLKKNAPPKTVFSKSGLSPVDEKLKKEQEALLAALDEKAASSEKQNKFPQKKVGPIK